MYVRSCGVFLALWMWCGVLPASAQSSIAGAAVSGLVYNDAGGPVAGAGITARHTETSQEWHAATDAQGRFRVLALPVGTYRIIISASGFSVASRSLVLEIGQTAELQIQLKVAAIAESVTVSAAPDIVDVVRTQNAESVTPLEVQTLPLNGRNYLDLALLTPGVSRTNTGAAQRFAETSAVPGTGISVSSQRNLNNGFIVDGLSANDDAAALTGTYFSQEVIREFQVISSGAIAEFGRTSGGIVNIVAQSGTNAFHGAAYGFFRHNSLDARNPLTGANDPFRQQQFGSTLGGPIHRSRDFFFINVEGTHNQRTGLIAIDGASASAINAAMMALNGRSPVQTGTFPTGFDTANIFGRFDRQWSPSLHGTLRYSGYHVTSDNARNVGSLNAVSRGTALDNLDQTIAFTLTASFRSGALHEMRAQLTRSRLDAPVNDVTGPAVNMTGIANFGSSTTSPTARALDVYQAVDTIAWQRGAHLVKAGADALLKRTDIVFPGALQGVYSISSVANLLAGRYSTYQQAFGAPSQFQSNPNLGVFAQDEWRMRHDLTANLGVRYDLQWLPDPVQLDANNMSPCAGLAWSPGNKRTVVRASTGLFFDRVPLRASSNALQRDGTKSRVAVLPFGGAGAPVFPAMLPQFPESLLISITTIDPNIQSASSRDAAVAVEHAIGRATSMEVGYQHVAGRGIIMQRNLNAPTVSVADAARLGIANLGRPDPRYANVSRYESAGRSEYDGMTVSLRSRFARGDARVAYTVSRALDDAGNFFFSQPQDANDVHADWGPSDNDQRHRLAVSASLRSPVRGGALLAGWRLSGIFSYTTALPFTPLTGTDRNNDTNVNDRPVGLGRNSFHGFDSAALDLRISRVFAAGGARLEFTADAFNVLNRANFALPNARYGTGPLPDASFGAATAGGDPRQIQLGVRISW
jgi:hypothetical protein